MLAIRLQRTGRSGHAQFRVIVQDSRFSPKRGRIVSYLGSYDPHTKSATIDSGKAAEYLKNGAQPSDRVARLFKKEGIKLPAWVKLDEPKKRDVRNPEKRRSTAPAKPAEAPAAEPVAAEEPAAEPGAEKNKAEPEQAPEAPSQAEPANDKPAEEPAELAAEKPAGQETEPDQAAEKPEEKPNQSQ